MNYDLSGGIKGGHATRRGARPVNEDRTLLLRSGTGPERFVAIAVADGMGGHPNGDLAAAQVVEGLRDALLARDGAVPDEAWLADLVRNLNRAVYDRAAENGADGRGTTLSLLVATPTGHVLTAHVGDSRIYMIGADAVRLLTRDHTAVEEAVRRGEITPDAAASHPYRNLLSRVVGPEPDVEADVSGPLPPEAPPVDYLAVSDGVWGPLSDDEIGAVLRAHPDPGAAAERLVEAAVEAGGTDNASAALLRIDPALARPASGG